MQSISNQSNVSFGAIKFVNQAMWRKNGKAIVGELYKNEALTKFVRENPDKNVIFYCKKQEKPSVYDFMYRVQDRSLLGIIKGLFSKGVSIAQVRIGGVNNAVSLRGASNISLNDLTKFGTRKHAQLKAEDMQVIRKVITPEHEKFRLSQEDTMSMMKTLSSIHKKAQRS